MGGNKKLKKWGTRAQRHADRAEAAAERAESALRRIAEITGVPIPEDPTGPDEDRRESASPVYTSPRGQDATPPAADVP